MRTQSLPGEMVLPSFSGQQFPGQQQFPPGGMVLPPPGMQIFPSFIGQQFPGQQFPGQQHPSQYYDLNIVRSPFRSMQGGIIWPDDADKPKLAAKKVLDDFMAETLRILRATYAKTDDTDLSNSDLVDGAFSVLHDYEWDQNDWHSTPVGQWYGINGTQDEYINQRLPGLSSGFSGGILRWNWLSPEEERKLMSLIYGYLRASKPPVGDLKNGRNVVRALSHIGKSLPRDDIGEVINQS